MARRKRASMREGPLADLFRSTASHEREQPTEPPAPGVAARATPTTREDGPECSASADATARPPAPPERRAPLARSPSRGRRIPSGCAPTASRSTSSADSGAQGAPQPDLRRRGPRRRGPDLRPRRARAGRLPRAAAPAPARDPGGRRRRRRRQRDQPDDRGADPGRRVHGDQHRPSVASAVDRRRHRPPRQRRRARPRHRLEPRARLPGRVRGAGQDQAPAEGLRHGLRHRRRRRRHRHRRGAGHRAPRPRRRRADRRDRHQAVPASRARAAPSRPRTASRR